MMHNHNINNSCIAQAKILKSRTPFMVSLQQNTKISIHRTRKELNRKKNNINHKQNLLSQFLLQHQQLEKLQLQKRQLQSTFSSITTPSTPRLNTVKLLNPGGINNTPTPSPRNSNPLTLSQHLQQHLNHHQNPLPKASTVNNRSTTPVSTRRRASFNQSGKITYLTLYRLKMKEDIHSLQPQEYFEKIVTFNKQIIIETKTIAGIAVNLDSNTENLDKILNDSAYILVQNTKALIHYIDSCPLQYDNILHYHTYFHETAKKLYSTLLEFIAAARALVLNPHDYLTSSKFKNSKIPTIELVKATVGASNNFQKMYYNPELDEQEEHETEHHQEEQHQQQQEEQPQQQQHFEPPVNQNGHHTQSQQQSLKSSSSNIPPPPNHQPPQQQQQQQPETPTISPPISINNSPLQRSGGSTEYSNSPKHLSLSPGLQGSPKGLPQSPKLSDSSDRINIEKTAVNLITNVNKIMEAALEGDHTALVNAAKGISNDVLSIAKDLKLKTLANSLKEAIVNVISLSRVVSKSKNNQYYIDQLELAVEKVNEIIRKTLYAIKNISKSSTNLKQLGLDEGILNGAQSTTTGTDQSTAAEHSREVSAVQRPAKIDISGADHNNNNNHSLEIQKLQQQQQKILKEQKEKEERERIENEEKEQERVRQEKLKQEQLEIERLEKEKQLLLEREKQIQQQHNEKYEKHPHLDKKNSKDKLSKEKLTMDQDSDSRDRSYSVSSTTSSPAPSGDKSSKEQKTIGKFLSKLVNKSGSKKRSPIPFEGGSPSPASVSTNSTPLSSSPALGPSPTSSNHSTPSNSSTTVSPLISKLEISEESPPISSEGNKLVSSIKERSLTIGMVNGKHSIKGPIILESPRQNKKTLAYESSKQILNLLASKFPLFDKEWNSQNTEGVSKITEQIASILRNYGEELSSSSSSSSSSTPASTPHTHSPTFSSMSHDQYELTPTNDSRIKRLYNSDDQNSNKEYQRSSLRYKMTRKLGTIKKRPANPFQLTSSSESSSETNESDASDQMITTASLFVEEAIDLVNMAHEFSIILDADTSELKTPVLSIFSMLKSILHYSVTASKLDSTSFAFPIYKSITDHIENLKTRDGRIDTTLIASATKMYRQFIENNLEKSINSLCNTVRVLAIQMTTIVISIAAKPWEISNQLQLFASSKSFCDSLVNLLDSVENKIYISTLDTNSTTDEVDLAINDDEEDVNIWQEGNPQSTFKYEWISDEGSKTGRYVPKAGTLNKLVEALTMEKQYDISRYTKTFLLTYQSFTNPWKLLDKLIQRYMVPEDKPSDVRAKIQLRVVSFIQTWVERNFDDFDDALIERLNQFRNNRLLMDDNNDLAIILAEKLAKKTKERKERIRSMNTYTFPELMIPEGQRSPFALFMVLNESEIARQLTLIEFNIFSRIEPTELLDQSWNKDSLKHKSPNIIELINRANKISYWVASLILWQEDIADRVKVIEKFILIAKYLREINNFNTLIGIFAGLNTASVNRLKKTFAQLSPNANSSYQSLEKLMSSQSSFKNYRNCYKTVTPPALPYLPVILSDLTFTEDGNPDKIGTLINFQKRELICRIISEVQAAQQVKYEYPIVEPIHTLLSELPSSTPNELYALSLLREPRDQPNNSSYGASTISVGGSTNSYPIETLKKIKN
eukprot:gene405-512_t